jgi:stress response protein SCP2
MKQLAKGGNAALRPEPCTVRVDAPGADVSAYLLDAGGKVRGDDDMVFYNQPDAPDGSVRLDGAVFRIDPSAVDMAVERIAICAVPEKGDVGGMGRIGMAVDDQVEYRQETAGMTEAAVILCEIYRRDGGWKIRAVAQGFNGGLAPLSRHFGIDVAEDEAPTPESTAAPTAAPLPAHVPAPPSVSLKKVTLEKAGRVELRKGGGAIRARLTWEGRRGGEGDLDLYCFYVMQDGTCGKVYWKDLGRDHGAPWITLSGDSKRAGEEEATIHRPDRLRYAMFAAYSAVGNGTGSFESFRPRMILTDQDGSEVVIPLLNPNSTSYWVAISHITFGDTVTIEHIETYGKSGIRAWIAAERAPRLHADGSWDVSKGPVEFKRN